MSRLNTVIEWISDRLTTILTWIGYPVLILAVARMAWLYPVWSAIGGVIFAIGAALVIVINRGGPLPYQYAKWRYARILTVTTDWIGRRESQLKRSMRGVLRDMQRGFYTWDRWEPLRDDYIARELMPLLSPEERAAMDAPGSTIRSIVNGTIDGDVFTRCERDGPFEMVQ